MSEGAERDEVQFLARCVHRGFLGADAAREALAALREGQPVDRTIVERGHCSEKLWRWIRRTEAGAKPIFPGYKVGKLLGVGGTAEVFEAIDESTGKRVALKILSMLEVAKPESKRRFLRESKLLIELDHPNIVKGLRLARFEDVYFLAMELVEGCTVLEILDSRTQLDEDSALYVVLQVARALEYLRQQGIVHRDVKPGNIMVASGERVKLIDLGFAARSAEGEPTAPDETSETTLGTAAYLSPELARGNVDVDIRSDIYALGATLYQLVLGKLPFEGASSEEVLRKQVVDSLSAVDLKGRKISPHLHYFIEKMMAKERELRYQDPHELILDIEAQIRGKKSLEYSREGDGDLRPDLDQRAAPSAPPIARPMSRRPGRTRRPQ
ncbi:MAG: serine/threonine protein kinase [Planctomycetes bacterium]|nr:serine/threonine protein kinase [Planctomycetota bacterium]